MHVTDINGQTPADLATLQGHTECAKFLLNEAMPVEQHIKKHIETGEVHTLRRLHTSAANIGRTWSTRACCRARRPC